MKLLQTLKRILRGHRASLNSPLSDSKWLGVVRYQMHKTTDSKVAKSLREENAKLTKQYIKEFSLTSSQEESRL